MRNMGEFRPTQSTESLKDVKHVLTSVVGGDENR